MCAAANRQIEKLRENLEANLRLDFMEDDEVKTVFDGIASFDHTLRQKILALCFSLSHASSAFVVSSLARIRKARNVLSLRDTEKWLTNAFDLLDAKGIGPYIKFIADADDEEKLRRFQSPAGLRLHSVLSRIEAFIQGISGMGLRVAPGRTAHTDTEVIYLPAAINLYSNRKENAFVYKLMSVHQWSRIVCKSLMPETDVIRSFVRKQKNHPNIDSIFRAFPEREAAQDLYAIFESIRAERFLTEELPGLMRDAATLRKRMFDERPSIDTLSPLSAAVEVFFQYYLVGRIKGKNPGWWDAAIKKIELLRQEEGPAASFALIAWICEKTRLKGEKYEPCDLGFIGNIRPDKVSSLIRARHAEKKKSYEGMINKLLTVPEIESRKRPEGAKSLQERELRPEEKYLLIKGRIIELDSELREIIDERQGIPGGILVKGSDLGSGSPVTLADLAEEEEAPSTRTGGIPYDEWDFRRSGYRKQWCNLYEHDVHPGQEPFVDMTIARYGPYVRLLRNKFELLKREPRILRRQKDGDDIDIDASVEAFSDRLAGLQPDEDLFIRLDRQERNIAVLFLLDMSGSTKGWVSEAEKESLVLMSEALEALGDRYAIYGFSGMTRTKCDYYRVKGFDEIYSEAVKSRIAGISPKDYTRMGPAIRHSISVLQSVDARTRLFVILSDGKPEDWDAYKGEYAIEDTRKALIEARERGIHPFCVTIDKEARSYLPHMYGESNYTLIDDVRKLPDRITEIYRRLTT